MKRFDFVRFLLVAFAVLAGLGLFGILAVHAYGSRRLANVSRRYEREVGPLAVRAFVRPKVAAEENAVTWQRPGVLAAVFFSGDQDLVGSLSAKRFGNWTAEETAKLEAILERSRPAIELLERARTMRVSNWEIPYEAGTTAKLPNLMAAINSAKLVLARGRLALGRGDRETAISSAETLASLARSHEAESATFMLVIGLAIERLHLALVHELVTSAPMTLQELDRLETSICAEDLIRAARQALRGNAAAIAHDVDSESIAGEIHGAIHRSIERALGKVIAAAVIESHQDLEKHLGEPVRAPRGATDDENRSGGWWKHLMSAYDANFESVSARTTATASARDFARLAIALRRQAVATGHYPASLPAIGGVSANDPLTGGPRVYEVHADGSAELRSTTTVEFIRSIAPGSQLSYDALYRFTLPAPRRGHVT
jgi:hypothetical protein